MIISLSNLTDIPESFHWDRRTNLDVVHKAGNTIPVVDCSDFVKTKDLRNLMMMMMMMTKMMTAVIFGQVAEGKKPW